MSAPESLAPTELRAPDGVEPVEAPEGTYVIHYGDLLTGRLIATIPGDASWTGELSASGSASISVPVSTEAEGLWAATPPGKTFWAVEWTEGRRIIAGGPVWSKSFDDEGFTIAGSGLFSMLAKRKLVNPSLAASAVAGAAPVTFSGTDLGTVIRNIVDLVAPDLPVVLEASRPGTSTRTYEGAELAWADQRIREITETDNGPEFLFLPRLSADLTHIEWALITGTDTDRALSRSTVWTLDATAPGQEVVGAITGEQDASTLGTTAWAKGAGTEKATVIRAASDPVLTAAGYPRLDVEEANDSEDGTRVQAYANGALSRSKRPARRISVQVAASWWWGQGARLGDRVHLIANHDVLGRVDLTSRVLAESGQTSSGFVTLTLADTLAEEGL